MGSSTDRSLPPSPLPQLFPHIRFHPHFFHRIQIGKADIDSLSNRRLEIRGRCNRTLDSEIMPVPGERLAFPLTVRSGHYSVIQPRFEGCLSRPEKAFAAENYQPFSRNDGLEVRRTFPQPQRRLTR